MAEYAVTYSGRYTGIVIVEARTAGDALRGLRNGTIEPTERWSNEDDRIVGYLKAERTATEEDR